MTESDYSTLTSIPCPVCRNEHSFDVMRVQDWLVTREWFTLMECPRCSARFITPFPPADKLPVYYKSPDYISHTDTRVGLISRLYHLARKKTLQDKRKQIEKETGLTGGILLDVGAGTGHFLHTMKKAGWTVTGVEPDPEARDHAKIVTGIELLPLESLATLEEKSYDVITLWHVLEHIHDLHGVMGQLKRLLKDGGTLVIAVPNYQSYDAEYYGKHWAAWDAPRHLYHFTPKAMSHLMADYGLRVYARHRMPLDSFYVSMLSEKQEKRYSIIRALTIGKISWWKSLFNVDRCSSIIYFLEY